MKFRAFSILAVAYTLPVILWGAYVRASGSGNGCGDHWPTCNGELVPTANPHTLIEYAHRASSGLALVVAIALCVWAFRAHPRGHLVRWAGAASLFFMLTEAAVGALLVKLELVAGNATIGRAIFMAIHLVNTFLLLGSMALAALWTRLPERPRLRDQRGLAALGLGAIATLILLGISGAVTALGDTLYPAASLLEGMKSDFAPTAHLFVRLRVWHPVIALASGVVLVATLVAFTTARPTTNVRRTALAAGVLYLTQLGLGVMNLVLLAPPWLQMVHLLVADSLWMALVVLVAVGLADRVPAVESNTIAVAT